MKYLLTLILTQFILLPGALANGAGLSIDKKARGTAGIDEEYLKETKDREKTIEREEETRNKMKENPRNPAFSESFEQVDSKEAEQQREEKKATE